MGEEQSPSRAPADQRLKKKSFIVVSGIALIIYILMYVFHQQKVGPEKYIGVWKKGNTTIEIEAKPDKEVKKSFNLIDGKKAELLLPVRVRSRKGQDLWLMTHEGIYSVENVEEEDALIFFCEICRIRVIFGLRRDGDSLEVGLPKYGYNDRHIHDAMWKHGQSPGKFQYGGFKWVTYTRIAKPQ